MQELLTMSRKEIDRVGVIQRVSDKQMTQGEASRIIGVTDRQVRRILAGFKQYGPAGLIHHLRASLQ